jgi:hypothetical protein
VFVSYSYEIKGIGNLGLRMIRLHLLLRRLGSKTENLVIL